MKKVTILVILEKFFSSVIFAFFANVRGYELLRCQRAYLSRYTNVTKRDDLRKPAASNGLNTLCLLRNSSVKLQVL
jgi:hypothetical protein